MFDDEDWEDGEDEYPHVLDCTIFADDVDWEDFYVPDDWYPEFEVEGLFK